MAFYCNLLLSYYFCSQFVPNLFPKYFVDSKICAIFAPGNKIFTIMARPKKQTRQTSFVTIRQKERARGRKVLYLDIYKDGKRSYEYLNLYLVPEIDDAAKIQNENTMNRAMAIRNERELIVINGGEFQKNAAKKILLTDWMETFRKQKEDKGQSNLRAIQIGTTAKHLAAYAGEKVTLADVDEDFCKGFIKHLMSTTKMHNTKNPETMKSSSAQLYFQAFTSALNEAVRKKLIPANPTNFLSKEDKAPIMRTESTRSYLTIEDVRKLIATPCKDDDLKKAFLFSCFTGLRISDIINLTWDNVIENNGNTYINIIVQKTNKPFTIKLSKEALRWMPERSTRNIFTIKAYTSLNRRIRVWATAAGIEKYVCFHTARHTFATMTLTLGADLYTVSKLLAHSDISVTQVYAEIINERKDKAVDLANGLFD